MANPHTRVGTLLLGLVAVLATPAACSSTDEPTESAFAGPETTEPADGTGGSTGRSVTPTLVDLGTGLVAPMDAHAVNGSVLVAQRAGTVMELTPDGDGGYDVAGTVIDLTDRVGDTAGEKGLLGLTTDPQGERLYLNHTRAGDGATVVLEVPLEGSPGQLSGGEPRELLVIDQPFINHNGGDIAWGPDGMLWIGTGDGGDANDPDGRAQRLTDPLGKILRLDPSLPGSGEDLAPDDNPYAEGVDPTGEPANPLVWVRGVRNPWRISFDGATGDLWIADVGQNEVEEVTVLRADRGREPGADLGWDRLEGDTEFFDPGPMDGWPDDGAEVIDPLFTYDHSEGCSISGGYVYHGTQFPQLAGQYLLSDYCRGDIRVVSADGTGSATGASGEAVVSINPDENGEPLVLGTFLGRLGAS
ncbi:MAG: PQQ-dependent sugar dehydrogenase [Microthrixaceae bacterium]|nr:PQQ-dependent sugar dehydrogenase [Microthrixaceae bacterium]MCO5317805.1 PQQ-dependent sugar dehydrogenase [Microthrixaceae bacterium]